MKRTLAFAGTTTNTDYSSQQAVRQLRVEVGLQGMLGFVVSASFHTQCCLGGLELISLENTFGRLGKCGS